MKTLISRYASQIEQCETFVQEIAILQQPTRIVLVGDAHSKYVVNMLDAYLTSEGVTVSQIHTVPIPKNLDENVLVLVLSYSGDTAQTLAIYRQLFRCKATVIAISSGGKIEQITNVSERHFVKLPAGFTSLTAVPYLFFSALALVKRTKILDVNFQHVLSALKKDIATPASELAKKIGKHNVAYISSNTFSSVAKRMAYATQALAKRQADAYSLEDVLSELVCVPDRLKHTVCVILNDGTTKEMEATKAFCKVHSASCIELHIKGSDLLSMFFTTLTLGDYLAYELSQ